MKPIERNLKDAGKPVGSKLATWKRGREKRKIEGLRTEKAGEGGGGRSQ